MKTINKKKKMLLNDTQINNAKLIRNELINFGITNRLLQIAIVCVCMKESGLIPKEENLNYTKERLRQCWPKTISEEMATKLEKKPIDLGNFLYSGRYGNGALEGYKYRGRGFSQLTFKGSYLQIGSKIGIDLVTNPEKMLNPIIAAKACACQFKDFLREGFKDGYFKKFTVVTILDVDTKEEAVEVAMQCNAGLATKWEFVNSDGTKRPNVILTEGYKTALSYFDTINSIL